MNRKPDVLCISTINWDFIWQGHQEIMSRLAADGHRVLFIENTGVRKFRVSDFSCAMRRRVRNWWRGTKDSGCSTQPVHPLADRARQATVAGRGLPAG